MKALKSSRAYVIHLRPYRNTSALVDFFTQEQGLIRAVVNGVYGQNKKQLHWKGLLQAFKPLKISWSGEGGLKTLVDIELQQKDISAPKGQFLYCSFYVNELLQRSLSNLEEVDFNLYDAYAACITHLLEEKDMHMSLRIFEAQLLHALGYGVDFYHDVEGNDIQEHALYSYNPSDGFHLCESSTKQAVDGKSIKQLAAGDLSLQKTRRIAKYVFHSALQLHVGLDDLKSRQFFLSL